jgi:preprotein translocase subunit YajC
MLSNDLLLAQNVQPKAAVPGVVQDSSPGPAAGTPAGSPIAGFLPILVMLVIFVPFFLLMSRRQKGDRVMTNAGLIGELVEMDDRIAKVKVAAGVTVLIVANTVSPFVEPEKVPAKDLKEAKALPEKK